MVVVVAAICACLGLVRGNRADLRLDRKKAFDEMDRAKRKRIRKALGDHAPPANKSKSRR